MDRSTRSVVISVCLILAAASIAWGQGAVGTLTGTVVDKSGAVVPGASVTVTNVATGVEVKTTTTSAGAYTLPYLASGTYKIKVLAPGFRPSEQENVILRVAQTLSVNITMEVGGVTEAVTVSSNSELLETGSAEIGRYITTDEFKTWPIFVDDGQRQIQSFIFDSLPGTTGGTFQGSINGGQMYSHEILIEGVPVGRADLMGGNNNEFSPSAEAIGEFKLQEGAIGAQYNGGQTAVANFSIKSGTNDLHGTGFLYLQNEALNAWALADKTTMEPGQKKPKKRNTNEGFSVGGPVYIPKLYNGRGRTFFFVNFEKDHVDELGFSGFGTVATPAYKSGDFSALLDPAQTRNELSGTQVGTDALGRPVIFGAIYDPRTTRTVNGSVVRDAFPGNKIPQSAFDPVAANILKLGLVDPTYNSLVNNISRISGCCPFFDEHTVGIKIDHNITEKHHFSAYYNHEYRYRQQNASSSGRFLPIPGAPTSTWRYQNTPGRMARSSLNSTLSTNLVNRVSAGFNRFFNSNGVRADTINQGWAEKIGITNTAGTGFPTFAFNGSGTTQLQGSSLAQIGSGPAGAGANGSWVLADDLTWIHGKHTVHFGYQYTRYYYNERNPDGPGAYTFASQQTDLPSFSADTGHSFASFLLGGAQSANRAINPLSDGFRQPHHAFYASDDFKVTPKLTVNVGLRWEIIPPFFERTNRISYADLSAQNPDAGNRLGALAFSKNPSNTYWKEFGPRFGFAYQFTNKMVIRGGYAMLNTPPIANSWGYSGFTYGYNNAVTVAKGTSSTGFEDDPALYLSRPFPSYKGVLPDTNPGSANLGPDPVQTTAPDANRPGYTQNWNFGVQYQIPGDTVVEVAYVGNKGTRLWGGQGQYGEMNGLPASMLKLGDVLSQTVAKNPQYSPYAGFPGELSVAQALRPYPQFFSVQEAFPYNTNSNYNSLQVTVTRHLAKGLGFMAGYTWSKTMTYVDAAGPAQYYVSFQDYYNRKLEHSTASFNYPQSLKITWVWETPFGKGRRWDLHKLNYVLGGWQLAANHNYHSGDPIQVASSGLNAPAGFSGAIRPDIVGGVPLTLGDMPGHVDYLEPTPYLNPAAFANVPTSPNGIPLRVGTAPRYLNNIRGPRAVSENFRLSKKFYFLEQRFVGVGMTMTNPFNRTSKSLMDNVVGDADFGKLRATGGGRTIQLEARVEF